MATPRIDAVLLAAGSGSRMGGGNKLLAELDGRPLLLHALDAVLASSVSRVVVVTGHDAPSLRAALAPVLAGTAAERVRLVHNAAFQDGLGASLAAGIAALDRDVEAAMVVLGDMPRMRGAHVQAVADAFVPGAERDICAPSFGGRRGHPVLWPARCFAALRALTGDRGGRDLLREQAERVRLVPVDDDGVLVDVDTAADLAAARTGR